MYSNRSLIILRFSILFFVLGILTYSSFRLHKYHTQFKKVIAFFDTLESSEIKNNLTRFDNELLDNINKQLYTDSNQNIFNVSMPGQNISYRKQLISKIYYYMRKMGMQLVDIKSSQGHLACTLLINDKKSYEVTYQFLQVGDTLILKNIENIFPLYRSVLCQRQYLVTRKSSL